MGAAVLGIVGALLAHAAMGASGSGSVEAVPQDSPGVSAPDQLAMKASPDSDAMSSRRFMLAAGRRAVPERAPVVVADLATEAEAAFAGYLDAAAVVADDGSWTLRLGSLRAADRAALGALSSGVSFSRRGDEPTVLQGSVLPTLDVDTSPAAVRARLGAIAELRAEATDAPVIVTADAAAAARVVELAVAGGLSPRGAQQLDGRHVVTLPDPVDRWKLAGFARACCASAEDVWQEPFVRLRPARWRVATTGPLGSGERTTPPAVEGGVSWTNGEAQVYRPGQVTVVDGALRLRAAASPAVSVDMTPFVSGMVISERRFGWGRIEIDARIPRGEGLWPALWMLPVAACDAPGRCPGYDTEEYVEIDLLETIGHHPAELHTSLHWFDPWLQSATEVTGLAVDDGELHTFALDWRPGVVRFLVDDAMVWSFATGTDPSSPVARPPDHRLVLNLAIGGGFAGDRLLGPTSPWWGDARVPAAYPAMDWDVADLVVEEVRHIPMR